jgi:archaellin
LQEEITQKVITLSVRMSKGTAKLTEQALQKAIKLFLDAYKKSQTPHGKQTLRQLTRQNAGVSNIEITNDNIKAFSATAKKYGMDFSLKKVKGEEVPRYLVFFKGRDADVMTAAFQEFFAKKLKRDKKPSIRKALAAAKEKSKQLNAGREKVKNLDRGRGL